MGKMVARHSKDPLDPPETLESYHRSALDKAAFTASYPLESLTIFPTLSTSKHREKASFKPEVVGGCKPLSPKGLKPPMAQSTMGFSLSSRESPAALEKVLPARLLATWPERNHLQKLRDRPERFSWKSYPKGAVQQCLANSGEGDRGPAVGA